MTRQIAISLLSIIVVTVAGCMPQPAYTPTPTKTPDPSFIAVGDTSAGESDSVSTPIPTLTGAPTETPSLAPPSDTPSPTETATETPEAGTATIAPPTTDPNLPEAHYWFERPIPTGWTDYLDRTYAYGSTSGNQYRAHNGADFWNPVSTPVVAVGNGTIIYAGTDNQVQYGPTTGFYGNLIVVEMSNISYQGQPVYTLYGHLADIFVAEGEDVTTGQIIGGVGGTGIALGPHLHFEVRVGSSSDYFSSTRNPDLWIRPYWGFGTLAGRVVTTSGAYLREVALTIRGPDAVRYTWTYAGDENIPDTEWGENFTYGDLPEGWYTVTTRSAQRSYSAEVFIGSRETTWLEFVFEE
ncbi:MAG: peptidoglycan DD-metalloendopeptidase family protein [Chloroflexi bacterium]|nr:peptidoglycan DD-metalloendopeptidase family protein [Chloroflexota bacterium]